MNDMVSIFCTDWFSFINVNVSANFKMTLGKTAHIENVYELQAMHRNLTCYLPKHNQYIFKHLIKNTFMP